MILLGVVRGVEVCHQYHAVKSNKLDLRIVMVTVTKSPPTGFNAMANDELIAVGDDSGCK